jgi:hypothetical protein
MAAGRSRAKKVPHGHAERNAKHESDPPGRDVESSLGGDLVGMGSECSGRHIGNEIADVHHAKEEHEESERLPATLFRRGVKASRQQIEEAVSE